MGNSLSDPSGVEGSLDKVEGMKLLDIDTLFEEEKITTRVKARSINMKTSNVKTYGYEIHMGKCSYGEKAKPLFEIYDRNGDITSSFDGAINEDGNVMGTYIHGVFDGTEFREYIINGLRVKKSIKPKKSRTYESLREKEIDKLADIVRKNIDMNMIYKIIGIKRRDKTFKAGTVNN